MQKILVTGASKGIGKAISLKLLEQGYQVIGISRNFEKFPKIDHFYPYEFDLTQIKKLPEFSSFLIKKHPDISMMICNAGKGVFGNLEEISFNQIEEIINLNFLSQVFLIKSFLPLMKKNGKGKIIIIGSEAALQGKKKGTIYCASKFALRGFAQALREECASSGINVSIINPGMVKTNFFEDLNFHPGEKKEEHLLPEDIAEIIATMIHMRAEIGWEEINLSPQKKVIKFLKEQS